MMEEHIMKKHILFAVMLFAAGTSLWAQMPYLGEMDITDRQVTKTADRQANVKMEINLNDLKMNTQHSLRVVPVIFSQDGSQKQELPPFVINGKIRDRVQKRSQALNDVSFNPDAVVTVRRKNGSEQILSYDASVPFKRWMIGGNIQLHGYITGCAQCDGGHETAATGDIFPEMNPTYYNPFIEPKEEIVKRRSETRAARLQFRQNSDNIRPSFKNNKEELDKVRESFQIVRDNKDLTITGIYVTGYASPEGTMAYNMDLSKRRAQAFTEYIKNDLEGIDRSLYHVAWKGEDWDELRKEVLKHPNLLKQDKVLEIIDNSGEDKDAAEEKLKQLVPPEIYERLLNEMYGPVRRNEYRIEYNVRHFSLDEGKQMIKENPQLMSVSEIHKVADSYGKGSAEYINCLLIGAKTYPNDVTAVNNAALALIEAQRVPEAIALLEKAPQDGTLLNMLGVAYAKNDNLEKAEGAFLRASEKGYSQAAENLKALRVYMDYIAE